MNKVSLFENWKINADSKPPLAGFDQSFFVETTWPCSIPLDERADFIFLAGKTEADLATGDRWFLRDGFLPLAWFFYKHPAPQTKVRLYVHISQAPLVPEAWRSQVGVHDVASLNPSKKSDLFICGSMTDFYLSQYEFESYFKNLRTLLANQTFRKVYALMPGRFFSSSDYTASYHLQFGCELARTFGTEIQVLNENNWFTEFDFGQSSVLNINNRFTVSYSHIVNKAMSLGATLLNFENSPASFENPNSIELSMFHGLSFTDRLPRNTPSEFEQLISMIETAKALQDDPSAHSDLPWPGWFTDACLIFRKNRTQET